MKKLTALLLGTVFGIAFTASDAFAGKATDVAENVVKGYFYSDDGRTGGYLGVAYGTADISDVNANYLRTDGDGGSDSVWKLDDGEGGEVQFGFDFGKIRFDWRLGALHTKVESVDNEALKIASNREGVLGYSTFNLGLDLYRFELVDKAFVNIAVTPYIGAGIGYGGGWLNAQKASLDQGVDNHGDVAGRGKAHTYEAGILVDLADWAGITFGYSYLDIDLKGHNTATGGAIESDLFSLGVRFTY